MKNGIDDLRDHLFETLEMLKDPDKPMEIERAKAVSDVAQTIINSAKVEVDLLKTVGGEPTSALLTKKSQLPPPGGKPKLIDGGKA